MSSFVAPQVRVNVYRPKTTRPIELPKRFYNDITSTRGLSGGSIAFTFPTRGESQDLRSAIALRDYLPDESIVQLLVKRKPSDIAWTQLNLGYVKESGQSISADGKASWSVTIPSADQKLRQQELFIDCQEPDSQSGRLVDGQTMPSKKLEAVFTNFASAIKEIGSLSALLKGMWNDLIFDLVNVKFVGGEAISFGGKSIVGQVGSGSPLIDFKVFSGEGYTADMIHVFQIMSQFAFGQTLNFYQILQSFCSAPLYECFFDPLTGNGYNGGLIGGWGADGAIQQISPEEGRYQVKNGSGALVFRPTPFARLFDRGAWIQESDIMQKLHDIKRISIQTQRDELFSGIHVGMSILGDDAANGIMFPVSWNPHLRAIYGHKAMPVKLDGVRFPEGKAGRAKEDGIKRALLGIQEMLFANFCAGNSGPLRNTTGTAEAAFDFYRVGSPITWKKEVVEGSGSFGRFGYVTQVTDRLSARGESTTSVSMKWIDRTDPSSKSATLSDAPG